MNEIVIVAAKRTAVGKFGGAFNNVSAVDIGAAVMQNLLQTTQVPLEQIDEVILGQVLTAGAGQNPARQSVIKAGLPVEVPALTVNMVCGSSLKSIMLGAQAIKCGDANVVIAGGQENMSMSPHVLAGSRNGLRMGDGKLIDSMIVDGLWDVYNDYHMGITAENVAKKYSISRREQDEFACASQNKAEAAQKAGKFADEIAPYVIRSKKGDTVVDSDEFPRHGTTLDSLAGLRPAFDKDGSVTAGNASGINDGAAMVMLMSAARAQALGLEPLARIKAYASTGIDPSVMGLGPISACKRCLQIAGWSVHDPELMEINEAFAAQAIAVNRELGWDTAKVNVNGGAIAIGHPIGASGARILVTLLHEMRRRDAKKGVASLCIGGGMGVALAVERD
ncbi:MAG: acetyl-CoA C-acetyltransferase [Sideroxyarcus sp.]|nr:acetyl-CoA C-acetyltransferase [Sideroxyarcus sp.]